MDERTCSVEGCTKKQHQRQFCDEHFAALKASGSLPPSRLDPVADRLWRKTDKNGPTMDHCRELGSCWQWTGYVTTGGYGQIGRHGSVVHVHRLSYEIHFGPIPDGLLICHRCDNRRCVRPDHHLFLGSHADNMADMSRKGRVGILRNPQSYVGRMQHGEAHRSARLTPADVVAIRAAFASGVGVTELGRRYGVHFTSIRKIVLGKTWRHVA